MNHLNIKYLHCFCEVRNKENKLVAAGSIQEISEQEFVILRRNGNIPGLKENMEVKVNIFNFSEGFCMVTGTVKRILVDMITVNDIGNISNGERRQAFRVEISERAEILKRKGKRSVLMEVVLRDLSLGGCLIETREDLGDIGESFELRFNFWSKMEVRLDCRICRKEKIGDAWRTGCSFTAYPPGIEDKLCAYIFEQQRRQLCRKEGRPVARK